MPIIPLTCPNCGGNLTVDSSLEAAVCTHCKKPYIVKDAVFQNYITNITNINADTVNVYSEKDFEIKGGKLIKYNGESDHVVIPSSVKIIGENAFADMPIQDVVIPDTVLGIEFSAFKGCEFLRKASVPGSAKLGGGIFENCTALENVELGSGISEIPIFMFANCSALKEITIPEGVTKIGERAFFWCHALKEITIPEGVTKIGEHAFQGCHALKVITIPEGVTRIKEDTFAGCTGLTEITIPASVTEIEKNAFYQCASLETVNYLGAKPKFDVFEQEEYPPLRAQSWVFGRTPYLAAAEQQSEQWKKEKRCQHCGGTFEGVFSKTCSRCGKPKDY